jgi:hypothetical protein
MTQKLKLMLHSQTSSSGKIVTFANNNPKQKQLIWKQTSKKVFTNSHGRNASASVPVTWLRT